MIRADWLPTLEEFRAFAALSGDDNPIHTDPAYAASHPFGRPVSHGMLIHSRLWALAMTMWPGRFRVAEVMFPNPAYADEPLVLTLVPDGATIAAQAHRADGTPVYLGRWEMAE